MNSVEICPQKVYEFWCEDSLVTLAKSLLSDPEFKWKPTREKPGVNIHPNSDSLRRCVMSVDRNLHQDERFRPVTNWIEECLEEIKNKHNYRCEKLSVTRLWGMKSKYKSDFYAHKHPFSLLSGVFYLTDSNTKTWFSEPSIWERVRFVNDIPLTRKSTDAVSQISSEKGKLIVFPSFLLHSVDSHMNSEEPRYTMSFNSFPSGDVGNGVSSAAGLNIQIL